jgi:hypothetical protein
VRSAVSQSIQLRGAEASQDGEVALCVFVIDFDHAADEELLFLGGAGLPVVGLGDCDKEAFFAGPLLALFFVLRAGVHVDVIFDG